MIDSTPEATEYGPDNGMEKGGDSSFYYDDSDSQIRDLGRADEDGCDTDSFSDDRQPGQMSGAATIGVEMLARLLDMIGLEGDVFVEESDEAITFNIEGDDLGMLIGRRGLTLSALQYTLRLMIAGRIGEWPLLTVDVCGYKHRRHAALVELARKLADQARYRRRPIALEPMAAGERRIVHLALANNPDVYTESTGDDADRKVVIHPKRS